MRPISGQLGEVTAGERPHAFHERLLGAGREKHHAQARRRLLAQRVRQRQQDGDAGQVVIGPRHGVAKPDICHGGRVARRDRGSENSKLSQSQGGGNRHECRPAYRTPHRPGRRIASLEQLREAPQDAARDLRVEDDSRVGRVVVRDHQHGLFRVRITYLGKHVHGGPPWQETSSKALRALDVVRQCGGREGACHHAW